MKEKPLKIIGFQVTEELDKWFQEQAEEELCSKSAIIRRLLVAQWRKDKDRLAKKKEGK